MIDEVPGQFRAFPDDDGPGIVWGGESVDGGPGSPNNASAASSDAAPIQGDESGPQPTPALQHSPASPEGDPPSLSGLAHSTERGPADLTSVPEAEAEDPRFDNSRFTSADTSVAWQRQLRDRLADDERHESIFGEYWRELDLDIKKARIEEIDHATARSIILKYEWLGSMPSISQHCFGIYFDGVLGGAVVYGTEYSANVPGTLWHRNGVQDNLILLARGACAHWAHPHSGSKLIRQSMKMLPEKYTVVTATTDPSAGEVGTLYQASGFYFLGQRWGDAQPALLMPNGRLLGSRAAGQMFGHQRMKEHARVHGFKVVETPRKGRYVAFRGSKDEQARLKALFEPLIVPYPKRESAE